MSGELTEAITVYDCERVDDTFILNAGELRLVAEGARWVGGVGAESRRPSGSYVVTCPSTVSRSI